MKLQKKELEHYRRGKSGVGIDVMKVMLSFKVVSPDSVDMAKMGLWHHLVRELEKDKEFFMVGSRGEGSITRGQAISDFLSVNINWHLRLYCKHSSYGFIPIFSKHGRQEKLFSLSIDKEKGIVWTNMS